MKHFPSYAKKAWVQEATCMEDATDGGAACRNSGDNGHEEEARELLLVCVDWDLLH